MKIEVERSSEGETKLAVSSLPHFEYKRVIRSNEPSLKVATAFRAWLKEIKGAQRVFYSTRHPMQTGLAESLIIPAAEGPDPWKPIEFLGVGVTLFGRHFLALESDFTIHDVQDFNPNLNLVEVWDTQIPNATDTEKGLIICAPSFARSLAEHVLLGSFAKWLERRRKWLENFEEIAAFFLVEDPTISQAFYRIRIEMLSHSDPLEQIKNLVATLPNASIKSEAELLAHVSCKELEPEEQMRRLLTELDADLLIYLVEPEVRATWDPLIKNWRDAVEELLNDEFWPGGKLASHKVKSMVPNDLSMLANRLDTDIERWCYEAREQFLKNSSRYVVRALVENMQQSMLDGASWIPFYAESVKSILSRWCSLLRKAMNHRLAEMSSERSKQFDDDRLVSCKTS